LGWWACPFRARHEPCGYGRQREALLHFLELDDYLSGQAIPATVYIDEATKRDWMTLSTRQLAARYGWTDQYQLLQANPDQRRAPQRLLARAPQRRPAGRTMGLVPQQGNQPIVARAWLITQRL
jgi:hypothetical protein